MITNIIAIYFGASFCFAAGVAFGVYAIKNGLFECVYNRKPKTGEIITGEWSKGQTENLSEALSQFDSCIYLPPRAIAFRGAPGESKDEFVRQLNASPQRIIIDFDNEEFESLIGGNSGGATGASTSVA